jgi:hypothetical protein
MTPTRITAALVGLLFVFTAAAAEKAATPKEAVGFFGAATGVVKSAEADGTSFVLTITKAEPDATRSAVKDAAAIVGKGIPLGTRMPRDKDGKPRPHEDDVAYIKSLKAGQSITVKVFAVRSDPSILRITGPGENAAGAEKDKAK